MILTHAPEKLFWEFISKRHAIYLRRQMGMRKPWTDDHIFLDYKFTNVFRQLDTGTQWLTENFITPHWCFDLEEIAFNVAWYRMFNWTGTGERLGWQTDWQPERVKETLREALAQGEQVFTGAHIIRSEFDRPKIDSIVDVCTDLYHMCYAGGALVTCAREERLLERVFKVLLQVPYVGPFMAYEIVTDLRHTPLLNDAHDIMTWANAGPGAKRGLERLDLPFKKPAEATASMRELLSRAHWVPEHFEGIPYTVSVETLLNGQEYPFEMRDIEHSLCEFDKYCRVKFDEGNRPRGRYRGRA